MIYVPPGAKRSRNLPLEVVTDSDGSFTMSVAESIPMVPSGRYIFNEDTERWTREK